METRVDSKPAKTHFFESFTYYIPTYLHTYQNDRSSQLYALPNTFFKADQGPGLKNGNPLDSRCPALLSDPRQG